MAYSKHTRSSVEGKSPISNGLTAVAVRECQYWGMGGRGGRVDTNVGPILNCCFVKFDMVEFDISQLGEGVKV